MSNLVEHAKREFLKLGYKPIEESEDDPNKWIQENVIELLEVFSKQGHSGSSAPYVIEYFRKLAAFDPIAPILCTDDEWNYVDDRNNIYQNNRCSAIFKNGENGKPYYIDAIIWKNQKGYTYTGRVFNSKNEKITSRQYIKVPFRPKSFYIDVIDYEISPDDWESYIKDESQLKDVWKYYEHQETKTYMRKQKLDKINELIY